MNADALLELKLAFQMRPKPLKWVREDLHPLDTSFVSDFVGDLQRGEDPASLFQSAIPYFALLTDEARASLLPDYLGTIGTHDTHIFAVLADLEGERGQALLSALTPAEQAAVLQFTEQLSRLPVMKFYSEELHKLNSLVVAIRTSRCTE